MTERASTSCIRLLYKYLESRGLDPHATLGQSPPPFDPTGRSFILVSHLVEMLERADQVIREPALGLSVGSLIEPAHLGLVGYLLLNCKNVAQAIARDKEFARLYWDQNQGSFRPELRGIRVHWKTTPNLRNRLLQEHNLASIVAFARNLCDAPNDAPLEVHFTFPRPADTAPYEHFFKCPVHFDAPILSMLFSYSILRVPIREPDESLYHILEAQARERIAKAYPNHDFLSDLQKVIAEQLANSESTLITCAPKMNCSARTLQRRLEELDTNFQSVLDLTRQNLSKSYLSDPALRMAELSQLVGYADQAAFTRAFKRWTGMSPSRWRKQAQQVPQQAFL